VDGNNYKKEEKNRASSKLARIFNLGVTVTGHCAEKKKTNTQEHWFLFFPNHRQQQAQENRLETSAALITHRSDKGAS